MAPPLYRKLCNLCNKRSGFSHVHPQKRIYTSATTSPVWRDFIGERDQPLFGLHCKDSTISCIGWRCQTLGHLVSVGRDIVDRDINYTYCIYCMRDSIVYLIYVADHACILILYV